MVAEISAGQVFGVSGDLRRPAHAESGTAVTAIQEAEQLSANRGTNNHPCAPPDLARLITMWFVCVAVSFERLVIVDRWNSTSWVAGEAGESLGHVLVKHSFNPVPRGKQAVCAAEALLKRPTSCKSCISLPFRFSHSFQRRAALRRSGFRQLLQLLLFLSPFVRHSCDKATQFAVDFDEQIKADASKHGDNYAYIVERSIRQTFGACELTVGKNDDGTYDKTDVMYFQKELSSGGFVNTVDVGECGLFSDHVKLNARLVSGHTNGRLHDLGGYPKAHGHNDGNEWSMPLEESGDMLIMALSYIRVMSEKSIFGS
ncbi:hypothetical protein BKA62DRAFT_762208 [Auriculariales sp. MPI-PUGE-AT-0066]|nr:hypothetical protein BKA62DRAFT_762208 [Auriculariales sp. MPI-PUGE-AT-0066]